MRSHGLSGVTTRQISKEVGCSEGALYVHFKGRLELLLAMLEESLPTMLQPLQALKESAGQGSPHENLVRVLDGIFKFHRRVVPATAGLFAEPQLLDAYRNSLKRQGKGPHLSLKVVEEYIRSEQQSGRIAAHVDANVAACLMMSASFFRAFVEQFFENVNATGVERIRKAIDCDGRTRTVKRAKPLVSVRSGHRKGHD